MINTNETGTPLFTEKTFFILEGLAATPTTADLFATYTWNEKMAFQLNVDNATDERYIITSTGVSQVSDPRRIRFQVRYLW